MTTKAKKMRQPLTPRVTTHKKISSTHARVSVKKKEKESQTPSPAEEIEKQYLQLFAAFPLPYNGLYTDDDSLEQPSAQKYVPSTTMPTLVS
ncbi:MAG TPA: hypothetical protein VG225_17135 [Terracidiphilus sp.]|nr:hypothetical protein [Terracidiphilus sp.]